MLFMYVVKNYFHLVFGFLTYKDKIEQIFTIKDNEKPRLPPGPLIDQITFLNYTFHKNYETATDNFIDLNKFFLRNRH